MQPANLIKRFATCIYELLILIAIWLLCTFVFLWLFGEIDTALKQRTLQSSLWLLTGLYFVICWVKTGQTVAMQAWKIKLVNTDDACVSPKQALLRYALATISLGAFGAGFLWALVDKEQLFLHDRLLKTRLVQLTQY